MVSKKIATVFALIFGLLMGVNGQIQKELDDFNEIKVFGRIEVRLEYNELPSIKIESGSFDIENVHFKVNDGILILRLLSEFPPEIKVYVTVFHNPIKSISANAGAKIYNRNELNGPFLNIEAKSGSELDLFMNTDSIQVLVNKGAFVRLTGKSKAVKLKTSTGGDFRATALASENLFAIMNGGTAEVNVSEYLDAKVRFGAMLKYLQQPKKIEKSISFKGTIGVLEEF